MSNLLRLAWDYVSGEEMPEEYIVADEKPETKPDEPQPVKAVKSKPKAPAEPEKTEPAADTSDLGESVMLRVSAPAFCQQVSLPTGGAGSSMLVVTREGTSVSASVAQWYIEQAAACGVTITKVE